LGVITHSAHARSFCHRLTKVYWKVVSILFLSFPFFNVLKQSPRFSTSALQVFNPSPFPKAGQTEKLTDFFSLGQSNDEQQAEAGAGEGRGTLGCAVLSLTVAPSPGDGKKPGPFPRTGRNALVLLSGRRGPAGTSSRTPPRPPPLRSDDPLARVALFICHSGEGCSKKNLGVPAGFGLGVR